MFGTEAGAGEDGSDPGGECLESQGRNAEEAPRDDPQYFTKDFQLQSLPRVSGREVRSRCHPRDQVLESLITQNLNIFHRLALSNEAQSFLNFPAREIEAPAPPERWQVERCGETGEQRQRLWPPARDPHSPQVHLLASAGESLRRRSGVPAPSLAPLRCGDIQRVGSVGPVSSFPAAGDGDLCDRHA